MHDGLDGWCRMCRNVRNAERRSKRNPEIREYKPHKKLLPASAGYNRCYTCEQELPISAFYQDRRPGGKLYNQCKRCCSATHAERGATLEGRLQRGYAGTCARDRKRFGKNANTLTFEQYVHKLADPCVYGQCSKVVYVRGLERINNSKPHTLENTVAACDYHNDLRGDRFQYKCFMDVVRADPSTWDCRLSDRAKKNRSTAATKRMARDLQDGVVGRPSGTGPANQRGGQHERSETRYAKTSGSRLHEV